jgi:hypothetical protein
MVDRLSPYLVVVRIRFRSQANDGEEGAFKEEISVSKIAKAGNHLNDKFLILCNMYTKANICCFCLTRLAAFYQYI